MKLRTSTAPGRRRGSEAPSLARRAHARNTLSAAGRRRGAPPHRASAARRSLRVDIERVERMTGRHEKPVALEAAEADVGAALGQRDKADRLAGSIKNLDPVLLLVAHPPAAPEVAIDVKAEAVGRAPRLGGDEGTSVRQLAAVVDDIVNLNDPRRDARLDDIKLGFVGREGEPVRPIDVA